MNQVQAIVQGFANLGNQICGKIDSLFGTTLNNQEEPHYLIFVDEDNQDQEYITLAANATARGVAQIGADSDFIACAIMRASPLEANANSGNQVFTFQMNDGSTSRDFSNFFVHSDVGMGTGAWPLYFAKPRIFPRNSSVNLTVTELAGNAIRVYACLFGYKSYDRAMLDLTGNQ